jgi:hypothetical protein
MTTLRNQASATPPPGAKTMPVRPPRRTRPRRSRRQSEGPRWDLAAVALAWVAGLT